MSTLNGKLKQEIIYESCEHDTYAHIGFKIILFEPWSEFLSFAAYLTLATLKTYSIYSHTYKFGPVSGTGLARFLALGKNYHSGEWLLQPFTY